MAETRYETIRVQLPAGTAAGTHHVPQALDTSYPKISGVVAYTNRDGGINDYQLGLQDDNATYVSLANSKHLEAGIDCPKPLRNTPLAIRNTGQKLTVLVNLPELLTADLDVDLVFTLERADRAN